MSRSDLYARIAGVPIRFDCGVPEGRAVVTDFLKDFMVEGPLEDAFLAELVPTREMVKFGLKHGELNSGDDIIEMNVAAGHINRDACSAVIPDASDQSMEVGEFIFDNFLRICFQFVILKWDGIIFHSSAVEANSAGVVFVAPNSGGKSTIAANSGRPVLSDDCVALRRNEEGGWMACSTPWGKVHGRGDYPLEAIFFITKSDKFFCRKIEQVTAVKGLFSNASLSFPDKEEKNTDIMDSILGIVSDIGSEIPAYLMGFRRDDNVIELLKKEGILCGSAVSTTR